jgi:hypothetical protein
VLVDADLGLDHNAFDIGEIAHRVGDIKLDQHGVIALGQLVARLVQETQRGVREINRLFAAGFGVRRPAALYGWPCCHLFS